MDTETRILYDNQERTEYVLKALPGTRDEESLWQIMKLHYQSLTSDNIVRVGYANNNSGYVHKATDYLLYKYTPQNLTILNPLKNTSSGIIIDFLNISSDFSVIGNTPDFFDSKNQFDSVDFIVIARNNEIIEKGVGYTWESKTSIKLLIPCERNQSLLIQT